MTDSHYLFLTHPASPAIFSSGLNTSSIGPRFPVLIATVAAMPGGRFTI